MPPLTRKAEPLEITAAKTQGSTTVLKLFVWITHCVTTGAVCLRPPGGNRPCGAEVRWELDAGKIIHECQRSTSACHRLAIARVSERVLPS